FAAAGAHAPRTLVLGRPAGHEGEWRIPLAMRLDPPAPGGGRWLYGELDVAVFSEVLRAHDVGGQGVASVLTREATLVARSDSGTRHAGLVANTSPVFQALAGAPGGVVESRSRLDGVTRVVGYREVPGRGLVATVGMTPASLHDGWGTFAASLALGVALLLAAWVAGMVFLGRAARRELRMRQSIAESEHAVGSLRERVRDAEHQYRFLYEQHPLPAVVYDREELTVLEVNAAAESQYLGTRAELVGRAVGGMLGGGATEDDVRTEIREHPAAYGRRIWIHRRLDGSEFSALVFARDITSFDGRPARLMLALDVSEQVRAEADLRLLRRAVESSGEGVFIVDAARKELVYGNEAFSRLGGFTGSRGMSLKQVAVDTIADDGVRQILRDALERGQGVSVEVPGPATLEGE